MLLWALPLALLLGYVIILSMILVYTVEVFNKIGDTEFDTTKEHLTFVRNLCIALFIIVCFDTGFNYWRQYKTGRFSTEITGWDDIHMILSGLSIVVGIVGLVLTSIAINAMDSPETADVEKVKNMTKGILITISVFFVLCFIQKMVYFQIFKQEKLVIKKSLKKFKNHFSKSQQSQQNPKIETNSVKKKIDNTTQEKDDWKRWNESKERKQLLEDDAKRKLNTDSFGDELESQKSKTNNLQKIESQRVQTMNFQNPYKPSESDSLDYFTTIYDSENESNSAFGI